MAARFQSTDESTNFDQATIALGIFQASSLSLLDAIHQKYNQNQEILVQIRTFLKVIFQIENHLPVQYMTQLTIEINRLLLLQNVNIMKEFRQSLESTNGRNNPQTLQALTILTALNSFEIKLMDRSFALSLEGFKTIYEIQKGSKRLVNGMKFIGNLDSINVLKLKLQTFGFNLESWMKCPNGHLYHKDEVDEEVAKCASIEGYDQYLMSDHGCIYCFRDEKAEEELKKCPSDFR